MVRWKYYAVAMLPCLVFIAGWQSLADQQSTNQANRYDFEVVQSFDARHGGDTPRHSGRAGGLVGRQPQVAVGDSVFRGEAKVGVVSALGWSPAHGTLEVEFRPAGAVRICVGDVASIRLGDTGPGKAR
jgi:hypothetical protein